MGFLIGYVIIMVIIAVAACLLNHEYKWLTKEMIEDQDGFPMFAAIVCLVCWPLFLTILGLVKAFKFFYKHCIPAK